MWRWGGAEALRARETLLPMGKVREFSFRKKETASTKQTWKQFFCPQDAQSFWLRAFNSW